MSRLDQQRQDELQPKRLSFAKNALIKMGYDIVKETESELNFIHNGQLIKLFPYSGWFSGKTVKDGRGINNLLKQLENG